MCIRDRLHADHPVPCKIATNDNAQELSLAENDGFLPMHPADEVVAFSDVARSGATVAAIAARFGRTERVVEQRFASATPRPSFSTPTAPTRSTLRR